MIPHNCVLPATFVVGYFFGSRYLGHDGLSYWLAVLSLPFPAWLRWVGAALGAASLPLLAWVQTALEKYWSALLHLRQEHKLITNGPYRWVRHPMYTALFTFFIATGLITANLGFIALDVLAISVLYLRIPKEENMMIEQFGE